MIEFSKKLIKRINEHDINSYAAQCAYYFLLAFFPYIILMIMLITTLGIEYLNNIEEILNILPKATVNLIKDYLKYSENLSTSVFSPLLISSILISSKAVSSLTKAFNIANNVKSKRNYLKRLLISVLFLLFMVIIFITSLSLSTISMALVNILNKTFDFISIGNRAIHIISLISNLLVYIAFIALIYYFLPECKRTLTQMLPGTFFAAFMLSISSNLFGYIVINFTKYSVVYGSLSSIIILLMWLFLCGLILILGEEINAQLFENQKHNNKQQKNLPT